jgi:flagellar biosynthetic protein FliR
MSGDDEIFVLLTRAPLMLPLFALVLVRISGLMLTAPIYGSQVVPMRIRAALAGVISLLMFPVVAPTLPADVTLASAIPGLIGELLIGLIMGLTLSLVFAGMQLTGIIVAQQAGLGLGEVFNPVLNTDATVVDQIFFLTAMTVFVIVGGHRELMRALLDTYATLPVLSFRVTPATLDLICDVLTGSYTLGLRLAAPVLLSLLIATLAMGFLSRTMPQLNILSIGFPIRALIALALCGFVLASAGGPMLEALDDVFVRLRSGLTTDNRQLTTDNRQLTTDN